MAVLLNKKPHFFSYIFFAMGLTVLFFIDNDFPSRGSLEELKGVPYKVTTLKKGKNGSSDGVIFNIKNMDSHDFIYSSISGPTYQILKILQAAEKKGKEIAISYSPRNEEKVLTRVRPFYSVLGLSENGYVFRSYEQISKSREANDKVGMWLALVFIVIGTITFFGSLLTKQSSQTP